MNFNKVNKVNSLRKEPLKNFELKNEKVRGFFSDLVKVVNLVKNKAPGQRVAQAVWHDLKPSTSLKRANDMEQGKAGCGVKPQDAEPNGSPQPSRSQPPKCPECGSTKTWKDGLRYLNDGRAVQRYICRSCGFRFSETSAQPFKKLDVAEQGRFKMLQPSSDLAKAPMCDPNFAVKEIPNDSPFPTGEDVSAHNPSIVTIAGKNLNKLRSHDSNAECRVGEGPTKNSAKAVQALTQIEVETEKRAAGAAKKLNEAEVKGKLVEFAWWMKKQGYSEATIERRVRLLKTLSNRGANLLDPESVKETIAKQSWSVKTKAHAVDTYNCFLKMLGGQWIPPKYKPVRVLPFIPTEEEIDSLIVGSNRKTAAFLQLLKETGMRAGEAWRLRWIDVDFQNRLVKVIPEKGGEPRAIKVTNKLLAMLKALPRDTERVFNGSLRHFARSFRRQRSKIAFKLQNPRIAKITFHTFRHWKATMEYAKTKDILHVMKLLGHKNIQNTLMYTQLVNFESDEYHVKTAREPKEIKELLEAGFEYVCEKDGLLFFRKRK